jgi:hypothetical protein
MKKIIVPFLILLFTNSIAHPADPPPVIGFCIAAPDPGNLDAFIAFMEEELVPGGINTLVLRIDYNYAYNSYPNLRDENPLSSDQVKQLVSAAREHGIRLIPQINLLGHQSWAGSVGKLLKEYPGFDETPSVMMPEHYEWPNEDGLYCKSYCPLHPELHQVVFALVDEIMEAFEADAFHAGMDEVFYIGEDECPRCHGRDRSELFAGEVTLIRDHLAEKGQELWIWGDRLLDGNTSGLGMWEASENDTHRAVDLIPKDVGLALRKGRSHCGILRIEGIQGDHMSLEQARSHPGPAGDAGFFPQPESRWIEGPLLRFNANGVEPGRKVPAGILPQPGEG